MSYSAKILADSVSVEGHRLTTFEVTFPRIVLAEFNTHRMLSRNSASSRAIPVEKRIASVVADPFIPESFGKNQKGMQASEEIAEGWLAREKWEHACADAVVHAKSLAKLGVHKQLANRLLEPFLWHTVIVSATEWSNFFALRCHPAAQPEIRKIAQWMRSLYEEGSPKLTDGWHLPLCDDIDELRAETFTENESIPLISIGRCARVSYLTHDGKREPEADIDLARRLMDSGHLSPFEHVARPVRKGEKLRAGTGNFRGWLQYRKTINHEDDFGKMEMA